MRHRNTRRRPYCRFGYYFITTNVSEGFAILNKLEFGYLLEHILHLSANIHTVKLVAYKINSDHVHLIAQIGQSATISEYVASWKRQFSRQVNVLLMRKTSINVKNPGRDSNPDLDLKNKFRWQPSYHSHLITSRHDFKNHIRYILNQREHHNLKNNNHCFIDRDHVFLQK